MTYRTPIDDDVDAGFRRIQQAVSALLEGYVVHRRIGHEVSSDEIVDAVMRLFFVLTRPVDGEAIDIDAELEAGAARRRGDEPAPRTPALRVSRSVVDAYALSIETLEKARRFDAPSILRHASFHGKSQSSVQSHSYEAGRLKALMQEMLADRWHLHRLVAIHDEEHLDEQIAVALDLARNGARRKGDEQGAPAAVEVRGVVLQALPRLLPLIAGERVALLGLDDRFHNVVRAAIALDDAEAAMVCIAHFEEIWNDRQRARPIVGPDGPDEAGIADLRRDLAGRIAETAS